MDYMKLGDLGKYIDFIWEEDDTKVVVQQVLSGLSFMHENGIAHRDLKPPVRVKSLEPMMVTEELRVIVQNIFLEWGPGSSLSAKIGDFGVSKHIPKDSTTVLRTHVGTWGYTAPEIFGSEEYTSVVDCWSVGCIAYRLLSGTTLFRSERDVFRYESTREPRPSTLLAAESCSPLGKSLIDALVDPMPSRRLSASAALSHMWCDLASPILGQPRSSKLRSKLHAACSDQSFNLKLHEAFKPGNVGMNIDKDIQASDLTPPSALPAEARKRTPSLESIL